MAVHYMSCTSSSFCWMVRSPSQTSLKLSNSRFSYPIHPRLQFPISIVPTPTTPLLRLCTKRAKVTNDEKNQNTTPIHVLVQDEKIQQLNTEVEESVRTLKNAAKKRKVATEDVLSALSVIEKAKIDPSGFLETLGGSKSPGRTWMLIFTAEKNLQRGRYFPITAVQRFDADAMRIENGVYLGSLGRLTFEGRFSWNKRRLAFIFECIRIKVGPFKPFEISFKGKVERDPSTKDPFFIWFYIDEEIAVARGRSGGTAFWVRCQQVTT